MSAAALFADRMKSTVIDLKDGHVVLEIHDDRHKVILTFDQDSRNQLLELQADLGKVRSILNRAREVV